MEREREKEREREEDKKREWEGGIKTERGRDRGTEGGRKRDGESEGALLILYPLPLHTLLPFLHLSPLSLPFPRCSSFSFP